MLNWGDERYVRVYTKDTPGWTMLPWQGRALELMLMRKLDRSGVLDFAEYADSEAALFEAMAVMTQLPTEVVEVGLPALLARGTFAMRGSCLVMPNFLEAQEAQATDAARMRAMREKKRDEAHAKLKNVTVRNGELQNVTQAFAGVTGRSENGSHAQKANKALRTVTNCSDPSETPPVPTPDDIPDDLGGEGDAVTHRNDESRNVTGALRSVTVGYANPLSRYSVPSRTVPSRAEAAAPPPSAPPKPRQANVPAAMPGTTVLPEAKRIATEIARHSVFESLDAEKIGEAQAGVMMTSGQKLAWVLQAVTECAAKTVGLGLSPSALQGKLVSFMAHARAPRPGEGGPVKPPEEIDFSPYENRNNGRNE